MLQALLEDRFQLKVHRATKLVPVYELTVAKGGPKLKPFDHNCIPAEPGSTKLTPQQQTTEAGYCRTTMKASGANYTVDIPGSSLEQFVRLYLNVSNMADQPVIDKTEITGLFDLHLVFTIDPDQPNPPKAVLQEQMGEVLERQLGLRLRPTKGPSDEFLVLDHIERRPSEN
jgi:uncharacterized protein (TIGR03435 family)